KLMYTKSCQHNLSTDCSTANPAVSAVMYQDKSCCLHCLKVLGVKPFPASYDISYYVFDAYHQQLGEFINETHALLYVEALSRNPGNTNFPLTVERSTKLWVFSPPAESTE